MDTKNTMSQMKKNSGCHLVLMKYWSNYLKDTIHVHEFLDPQLPTNDKLYYLGDKTRLFFISEKKTAAILDLWVKYCSIYLKLKRNEFLDHKSHKDQKLHIFRWQTKIYFQK